MVAGRAASPGGSSKRLAPRRSAPAWRPSIGAPPARSRAARSTRRSSGSKRFAITCPRTSARASRGRPSSPRPGPRSPSPARRGGAPASSPALSAVSSAAMHRLLGEPGGDRRPLGDRRAPAPAPPRASVAFSTTLLTRPHCVGLAGVEAAAGQHELHRPLLAEHARQPLGAAAAGDDPEGDLGLAEDGRLGGDDHVAGQRQLAAAAERVAGDRGDQRRLASRRGAARTPAAGW